MRQLRLGKDKPSEGGSGSSFKERIIGNWRLIFVLLVIMAVAFILRVFFAYDVAVAGGYGLSGGSNAAYHVVVIEHIMANWSHLVENPAVNYPFGEINVNPPLMDWVLAIMAQFVTLFGVSPAVAAEGTLIWSTAILGTLTCIPIYYLGKEMFNHRTGVISSLLYAVCAIAISQTVLSNGTEAAFYGFFFSIMLLYLYRAVKASKQDVAGRTKGEFKSYAKGVFGANRLALKYAVIAGIMLAIVQLSWNGFRPIVVMVALMMVVQTILDRIRHKDPTSVTLIFATVLIVSTVISAPLYALAGLWSIVYTGPFMVVILSVIFAAVMSETKGRPWLLVLPILIIAFAVFLAVLWFAAPGLYSDIFGGNSIYFDPTFRSLVEMNTGTSLSAMAGYYGWLTLWLPYIVIAFMFYRFRENLESHSKTFILMWLIAMMAIGWTGSHNVYLAAPGYVVGAGAFLSWMLEKGDFRSYVAGFRGTGFHLKSILKRIFQPVPLVSLLVAVFLVAAPNAMYAIDASTSTNQKSASSGSFDDYMGAFGYYVKNDSDWRMNDVWSQYSDQDKSGALASWWDYSAEAVANGGFDTVAGINGSGAAAVSNMLLSSASGSNIAMAVRLMGYEGIEGFRTFLTVTLGLTSDDYDILKEIVEMSNTGGWRSSILGNPGKYGTFDSSISDENVMYVAATHFLLKDVDRNGIGGLTLTETVTLYDEVRSQSGRSINYLAVSRGMFPIASGDGSVFSTLAFMNNYFVDRNGAPIQFYTMNYSGTYNYTQAMYDSVLWRAYIGPSPSDLGYSSAVTMMNAFALSDGSDNTRPQPGFGLSNYKIGYWKVMYNPDSDANQDSDGWVEMDAFEAMDIQDDLRARGQEAGLINFMSGLPVVLEYVPSNGQNLIEGDVTSGSSPVKGARVSVFDENGMQMATVFTDASGHYAVYVPYDSGKITISVGSSSMKGGLVVRSIGYTSNSIPSPADTSVDVNPVTFNGRIFYEELENESDWRQVTGKLSLSIKGEAHGEERELDVTNGTFTFSGLIPDKYTLTVKDENGNTINTTTYDPVLGTIGSAPQNDILVNVFLTTATISLDITDEEGSPVDSVSGIGGITAYVKLESTGDDPYVTYVKLENGKASVKVIPGTYRATLVKDDSGMDEHDTHELFDKYVTVTSGGTSTLTAKAQLFEKLTVSYGVNNALIVHATNGGYQTSVSMGAGDSSITFKVPTSIESESYYYVYGRYTDVDGKEMIVLPTADGMGMRGIQTNVNSATVIALDQVSETYEFTRTMKTTEGKAVTGHLNFYPEDAGDPDVPLISVWSADGNVSAWLPAGKYIMHAYSGDSGVREAYMEKIEIAGPSRGGDIDLVKGRTATISVLYSTSGSNRISYANLTIADSDMTIDLTVDGDGRYGAILPANGSYSFTVNRNIGSFIINGTDNGGKVTQMGETSANFINATFRTSTPAVYTDSSNPGEGIYFADQFGDSVSLDANNDKVKVKLKLSVSTSTEVEFELNSGRLPLNSYALSVGDYTVNIDKKTGYYYSGTIKLFMSDAAVKIEVKKLDIVTFEKLSENDKITVEALDSSQGVHYSGDREETSDGSGEYTETYYFEQGKQFQVKVTDQKGEKVWYYYHNVARNTSAPGSSTETIGLSGFTTVKGYAGFPASGLVTIEDSNTDPQEIIKIVVKATSGGRFTVDIPDNAVGDISFSSVLGSYLDANDVEQFIYSATGTPRTLAEIKENGSVVNMAAVTVNPKPVEPPRVVTVMLNSSMTNGEATAELEVTGNTNQSLFPSGGSGWEWIRFYGDSTLTNEIDHISGSGTVKFWIQGKLRADVALDSSSLLITLRNAAGVTVSTCDIDLAGVPPSHDIEKVTIGTGDKDIYRDSEYKFSILLNNESDSSRVFTIVPEAVPAGWHLVFTDTGGEDVRAATMDFTVPGYTEMTVYVKLINDGAESLPESFNVEVTVADVLLSNVHAGENAVLNAGVMTVTVHPTEVLLDNNGGGATGPNVFGSAGSISTVTWALIVITILLFVLILWMGMKRGVFLRKK